MTGEQAPLILQAKNLLGSTKLSRDTPSCKASALILGECLATKTQQTVACIYLTGMAEGIVHTSCCPETFLDPVTAHPRPLIASILLSPFPYHIS